MKSPNKSKNETTLRDKFLIEDNWNLEGNLIDGIIPETDYMEFASENKFSHSTMNCLLYNMMIKTEEIKHKDNFTIITYEFIKEFLADKVSVTSAHCVRSKNIFIPVHINQVWSLIVVENIYLNYSDDLMIPSMGENKSKLTMFYLRNSLSNPKEFKSMLVDKLEKFVVKVLNAKFGIKFDKCLKSHRLAFDVSYIKLDGNFTYYESGVTILQIIYDALTNGKGIRDYLDKQVQDLETPQFISAVKGLIKDELKVSIRPYVINLSSYKDSSNTLVNSSSSETENIPSLSHSEKEITSYSPKLQSSNLIKSNRMTHHAHCKSIDMTKLNGFERDSIISFDNSLYSRNTFAGDKTKLASSPTKSVHNLNGRRTIVYSPDSKLSLDRNNNPLKKLDLILTEEKREMDEFRKSILPHQYSRTTFNSPRKESKYTLDDKILMIVFDDEDKKRKKDNIHKKKMLDLKPDKMIFIDETAVGYSKSMGKLPEKKVVNIDLLDDTYNRSTYKSRNSKNVNFNFGLDTPNSNVNETTQNTQANSEVLQVTENLNTNQPSVTNVLRGKNNVNQREEEQFDSKIETSNARNDGSDEIPNNEADALGLNDNNSFEPQVNPKKLKAAGNKHKRGINSMPLSNYLVAYTEDNEIPNRLKARNTNDSNKTETIPEVQPEMNLTADDCILASTGDTLNTEMKESQPLLMPKPNSKVKSKGKYKFNFEVVRTEQLNLITNSKTTPIESQNEGGCCNNCLIF